MESSPGEWSCTFPRILPKPEKGFASLSLFTPRRFAGWFGTDGRFTPLSQRLHLLVWVMRKRETIKHSQGGGSWQRITSSSKGVLRPLQPHSWCPYTRGRDGRKKNPPPTSQKVDIFISPWYTVYAEGRQGFSIDLRGLLTTFRASEVYGSCISRICGFCEFSRQCVLL